jgi:hypothetical protein
VTVRVVAKNNVLLDTASEESGRMIVTAVLLVILAEAGTQILDPGSNAGSAPDPLLGSWAGAREGSRDGNDTRLAHYMSRPKKSLDPPAIPSILNNK